MARRAALAVVFSLVMCSAKAWAGKGKPLNADWSTTTISTSQGVFDDGTALYDNGFDGVQCYFGVNGGNVNLITYNTTRMLSFRFDTNSMAWQNSGLNADVVSTVTLYGVNYFGQFESMGTGTTAQVKLDVEFKQGNLTYELTYQSIAAMRDYPDSNTWLITSSPNDIPGYPGFTASDQAALSVIKKHSQQTFGTVNMPIRFEVTLAQ